MIFIATANPLALLLLAVSGSIAAIHPVWEYPRYREFSCHTNSMTFKGNILSTDCDYYNTLLGIRIDTDRQVMAWMRKNA